MCSLINNWHLLVNITSNIINDMCFYLLYVIEIIFLFKVMELETQVQVSGNQLRRQDEDNKAVREQLELAETKQRDLVVKLREQQNKYTDLESKVFR